MAHPKPPVSRSARPHRPPGGHRRRPPAPDHPVGAHRGIDWQALSPLDWATTNATLGARLGVSPSLVSRQRRRYNIPSMSPAREAMLDGRLRLVATRDGSVRARRPGAPQGAKRKLTLARYIEAREAVAAAGQDPTDVAVRAALVADGLDVSRTTVRLRRIEAQRVLQRNLGEPRMPTVDEVFEMAGRPTSITRADVRAQLRSDRRAGWWIRHGVREEQLVPIGRTRSRRYLDARTVRLLDVELDVIDALLEFYHRPCDETFDQAEQAMAGWAAERAARGGLDGLSERGEAAAVDHIAEAIDYYRDWIRRQTWSRKSTR